MHTLQIEVFFIVILISDASCNHCVTNHALAWQVAQCDSKENWRPGDEAVPLESVSIHACHGQAPQCRLIPADSSETTTAATTLPARRIVRGGCDVLNPSDFHAGASQSAEGRLGTGAGGLGAITCIMSADLPSEVSL